MAAILRMMTLVTVVAALITGGLTLWQRRETVKRTWDSLGGLDGITDSADRFMKVAAPVKDLVTQVARMK